MDFKATAWRRVLIAQFGEYFEAALLPKERPLLPIITYYAFVYKNVGLFTTSVRTEVVKVPNR